MFLYTVHDVRVLVELQQKAPKKKVPWKRIDVNPGWPPAPVEPERNELIMMFDDDPNKAFISGE